MKIPNGTDMQAMTKGDLVKFLDMIARKGWVNPHTGAAYKAAVNKILGDVPAEEDPRKLDVKTAVFRYNNLHPGELKPESLRKYEARVAQAVDLFVQFKTDPTTFKAPQRTASGATPEKQGQAKAIRRMRFHDTAPAPTPHLAKAAAVASGAAALHGETPTAVVTRTVSGAATETNLVLPFPLRTDYLAQIVVPIDLSADEADRLCAFIKTLARAPK